MKATFIYLFTHELPYGDVDKKKQWELVLSKYLPKLIELKLNFDIYVF
jgi:hypothetical protein